MACSNILEIAPDSLVHIFNGVISKWPVLEHMHMRKMACHAKTQPLFVHKVDSAYAL